jgi:hypothetical protein
MWISAPRSRTFIAICQFLWPAVLSLCVPACHGESNLPNLCKVITKAEAEAVLGEPVRDPEPSTLGGTTACDYKTIKVYGGVSPYWIHIAIAPEKQQVWDAGKKLHAKELRPVAGIGDDAYFLLDELDVFTKQRSVTIDVVKDIDKPDHAKVVKNSEKAVAQKAIYRIQ